MRVTALIEYKAIGDDEYRYIERWEDKWDNLNYSEWKKRFIRHLLSRGVVCEDIKILSEEYVRD